MSSFEQRTAAKDSAPVGTFKIVLCASNGRASNGRAISGRQTSACQTPAPRLVIKHPPVKHPRHVRAGLTQ
jgi:hypothetical protein